MLVYVEYGLFDSTDPILLVLLVFETKIGYFICKSFIELGLVSVHKSASYILDLLVYVVVSKLIF